MKHRYIHIAFIGLLGLFLSTSLFGQGRREARGNRGETPQRGEQGNRGERGERGERGNRSNEAAAQRKIIQAQQKAAIALANAHFKLDTIRLRENAKSATDSNAKNLARMEADAARRNHKAELRKIRAQAQAAINALKK